jgi:hypothetical protein
MCKSIALTLAATFVLAAAALPIPAAAKDKVRTQDITVTKRTDTASPKVMAKEKAKMTIKLSPEYTRQ